jgi:hypothetical protein
MTERRPIRSEEELAGAFDQLFDEIPAPQTREEIYDYIREAGIDPDEFGAQIKEITSKALQISPLNWRNSGQEEIERARKALDKFNKFADHSREELLSTVDKVLGRIIAFNPKLAPIHHRNRAELSVEDLASLLEELMFIADQSNIDIHMSDW